MDPLSSIMESLKPSSRLFSRARFTAPWGASTPGGSGAIFHALAKGRCFAQPTDHEELYIEEGDIVVFAPGVGHTLSAGPGCAAVPIQSIPPNPGPSLITEVDYGGGGLETEIICGAFTLNHGAKDFFWQILPPVIHIPKARSPVTSWLGTTLEILGSELNHNAPGSSVIADRLADILFIQVLRAWALSSGTTTSGWIKGLRDERVATALALMHQHPGRPWTATSLAERVGMSRSSFFSQFSTLVGEPPSRYLTKWRMHTAADTLRGQDIALVDLAERVGYRSEDAFAKAFRRVLGCSPSQYRRGLRPQPRPL